MMHHDEVTKFPRRRSAYVAIFLVLVFALSGCASGGGGGGSATATTTKGTIPKFDKKSTMGVIQARGKLIVGVVPNMAPFSAQDPNQGTWEGFDIELAEQIARSIFGTNIEGRIQWIPLEARDREDALAQQRVDIALGRYVITLARKRYVDFAGPYYRSTQDVLVKEGRSNTDTDIRSLAQLTGKKICVVPGSTNVDALAEALPGGDLTTTQTTVTRCGALLTNGTVTAVAADHVDTIPFLLTAGDDYVALKDQYGSQPYGVGIHLGTTDLRSHINTVIEQWTDYDSLYRSTTGDNSSKKPKVDRY